MARCIRRNAKGNDMATERARRSFRRTWLPKLLKMRTTKKEARLLAKCFGAIIAAMDAGVDCAVIELGCPHCIFWGDGHQCSECRYHTAFPKLGRPFPCMKIPFNGVRGDRIRYLEIASDKITVYECGGTQRQQIRDFCNGHLIWARAVLEGKK